MTTGSGPLRPSASDAIEREVELSLLNLLSSNSVRGIVSGMFSLPLIGYALFQWPWPPAFWQWSALLLTALMAQLLVHLHFRRASDPDPRRWAMWTTLGCAIVGASWSVGLVAFIQDDPHRLAVLLVVLLALLFSASMGCAPHLPSVYALNLSAALPFIFMTMHSVEIMKGVSLVSVLMLVLITAQTHGVNASLRRSGWVSAEKRFRLSEDLAEKSRRLEATNVQLETINQQLQAANRHKSEFLAGMSHELRTPLNAIIGYSEMLQEDALDRNLQGMHADLRRITSAGKHLLVLVSAILDLSKIEAGRMDLYLEPVRIEDLMEELEDVAAPLIAKNGNRLTVDCGAGIPTFNADRTKLRQILLNLVGNAAKFTTNGEVSVHVSPGGSAAGDPWIVFRISDTGIGMDSEQLGRLFQDFSQGHGDTSRRYGGTGLGLSLSRRLARLMGGDISVESAPGEGSTFTLSIPAAEVPGTTVQDTGPSPVGDAPQRSKRGTILVIDDDRSVRDLVGRLLFQDDFRVLLAAGGAEGLRMAREHRPDVIILDIVMPGVDGWSVLGSLKADPDLRDLPVIILSVLDDRKTGYALGATDYLTKPVDRHQLSTSLSRFERGVTVLVVDDDEVMRLIMARMLEAEGYKVRQCAHGAQALDLLGSEKPALVLLDLLMPGMDGFELAAAMRENAAWCDIPIIVLTGKDLTDDDHARLNSSVIRVLKKSGQSSEYFLNDVRKLVSRSLRRGKEVIHGPDPARRGQ